jgi:hypothetical protein
MVICTCYFQLSGLDRKLIWYTESGALTIRGSSGRSWNLKRSKRWHINKFREEETHELEEWGPWAWPLVLKSHGDQSISLSFCVPFHVAQDFQALFDMGLFLDASPPLCLVMQSGEGFKWVKTKLSLLNAVILNWRYVSVPTLGHLQVTKIVLF